MKMIGLLGGTSWPSTIEYYRYLNSNVAKTSGGFHSANLILRSIDYHSIKSKYGQNWDEIPSLLQQELAPLIATTPCCILICNNTLHRAYDEIEEVLSSSVPFIHMVKETANKAVKLGMKSVLLLGTKDTMENGYYQKILEENNLHVLTPNIQSRNEIQRIQTQLASGKIYPEHKEYFKGLIAEFKHTDGVILGCTELPLAISEDDGHPIPLLNPLTIQCDKALSLALHPTI